MAREIGKHDLIARHFPRATQKAGVLDRRFGDN